MKKKAAPKTLTQAAARASALNLERARAALRVADAARERERKMYEQRAAKYREFREWATHYIADTVLRSGFSNLGSCVDMIAQSLRTMDDANAKREAEGR